MRFVRLGLGIAVIIQAIIYKDITMGILGLAFTAMPIFNVGCCGVNGCAVPTKKNVTQKNTEYEEVN